MIATVALTLVVNAGFLPAFFFATQTAAQPTSTIRVLSTTSGSQGEERAGRYVILDPRNTFQVPSDRQVVISFQWLGSPGKHQIAGTWKGPGGLSVGSQFEYVAAEREFSAYWTLPLTAAAPLGPWTFEAQVDGEPAGTHAFEVVGADGTVPAPTPPRPMPLTRSEMLTRSLAAAVNVEGLDATGRVLERGPGTLLNDHTVVTAFRVVNGAVRIRVKAANGASVEIADLLAYDRHRDWALLKVTGVAAAEALLKPADSPPIGSGCATLSAVSDGGFSVTTAEVVGVNDYPGTGRRLSISLLNGGATPGAPVVNEYGELVGVVSEGLYPGIDTLVVRMGSLTNLPPTLVIPATAFTTITGAPMPLADLAAKGVFTPRVVKGQHVLSGGFATKILRDGGRTQPVDQKTEFTAQDQSMTVFVTWDPKERLKTVITLRLFDQDNRLLAETKPAKTTLRVGSLPFTTWELKVPPVAGIYRADVVLGSDVAWRGFFRVER